MKMCMGLSTFIKYSTALSLLIGIFPTLMFHTTAQDIRSRTDEVAASRAADEFMVQYKKSMDLIAILDQMLSSKSATVLRNTPILKDFGFDSEFVKDLDDVTLIRVYKTFMHTFLLGYLYGMSPQDYDEDAEDLPDDVTLLFEQSRIGRLLKAGDTGKPIIRTREDLEDVMRLQNKVAAALKQHLPQRPFETASYKSRCEYKEDEPKGVKATNGDVFGLSKQISVYEEHREFLRLYFVKDAGTMKILHVGICD